MRINYTSHFKDILNAGESNGAISASIQSYWTFFNFKTLEQAQAFNKWAEDNLYETNGVNTERYANTVLKYIEVSIKHPK